MSDSEINVVAVAVGRAAGKVSQCERHRHTPKSQLCGKMRIAAGKLLNFMQMELELGYSA